MTSPQRKSMMVTMVVQAAAITVAAIKLAWANWEAVSLR